MSLALAMIAIAYLECACISTAAPAIKAELGWSATTAATGVVGGFTTLFAVRLLVRDRRGGPRGDTVRGVVANVLRALFESTRSIVIPQPANQRTARAG